ncbi:MAG: hypothetical protein VW540_05825, partial [Gammaproteobacteria bacterium]
FMNTNNVRPVFIFFLESITGAAANLFFVDIMAVEEVEGSLINKPSMLLFFIPNFNVTNFEVMIISHNIV